MKKQTLREYRAALRQNARLRVVVGEEARALPPMDEVRALAQARREAQLLRKYGMTSTDVEAKLAAQGDACGICRCALDGLSRVVDHCHATGVVREILCNACNLMLGQAGDDPAVLRAAAAYLERFGAKPRPRTARKREKPPEIVPDRALFRRRGNRHVRIA